MIRSSAYGRIRLTALRYRMRSSIGRKPSPDSLALRETRSAVRKGNGVPYAAGLKSSALLSCSSMPLRRVSAFLARGLVSEGRFVESQ